MNSKTLLPVALALSLAACKTAPDYGRALPEGAPALIPLRGDEERPDLTNAWYQSQEFLPALVRSIDWTRSEYAKNFFPIAGITHERALASLERFHELLLGSPTASAFRNAFDEEFTIYKSAGWNGRGGGVLFTGYCTPILPGRAQPSATYHYPLYSLPADLEKGPSGEILGRRTSFGLEPYPARKAIEAGGFLEGQGLELVWLADPIDAFIAHVNGSAIIELGDESEARFGYAGKNGRPYTSLGKLLIEDDFVNKEDMNLAAIRRWSKEHPELVEEYLNRNESYVFFTPIDGNPRGSLNVEVSSERTLATDKTLFPRGALVFVDTELPLPNGGMLPFRQLMLDQDTGGAIRTAGRADIYLGIGPEAEQRAGTTQSPGQLYYVFLNS